MSLDGPTSPDDPGWVDEIVRRALERAENDDAGLAVTGSRPAAGAAAPDVPPAQPPIARADPNPAPAQPAEPRLASPTLAEPTAPEDEPGPPTQRQAPAATTDAHAGTRPDGAGSVRIGVDQPPAQAQPSPTPAADVSGIGASPTPAADVSGIGASPTPAADVSGIGASPTEPIGAARIREPERPGSSYPIEEPHVAATATLQEHRPGSVGDGHSPYPDLNHPVTEDPVVGLALDEEPEDPMGRRMRGFLEWGAVIVGALAVALVIKTFLMQAYFIPSSSMEPTLNIGDRVLVNKLSYSFGDISRGDLVVFNRPASQPSGEDDLIKRVIGLPGEVIEIRDGEVFITVVGSAEQQRLEEPYVEDGVRTTGLVDTSNCVVPDANTCEIPDGHVFVLGDNRAGSRDSRFFGPIPDELVVGRAFMRVWPLSELSFL